MVSNDPDSTNSLWFGDHSYHSGQTSSMRKGINLARPLANFPRKIFKENQRSILQMLQELCSRKWEEEKRETFKTRSFSNACILLMNHFYFELAHLDLLACVAVYDPCYTISF